LYSTATAAGDALGHECARRVCRAPWQGTTLPTSTSHASSSRWRA